MDALWQDIRFAARMLLKHRSFSIIAIITLALGSGVNTAVFSIVNTVLLQELPYQNPDRLAQVWETNPQKGIIFQPVSAPDFIDWRDGSQVFEQIAAYRTMSFTLTGQDDPLQLAGVLASTNLFSVIGVNPALGRSFNMAESQPGNDKVVLISNGLWRRRFNSDSGIIGQPIQLNGEPHVVIGILPPDFQFKLKQVAIDLWAPLVFNNDDLAKRDLRTLQVVGLLKPDMTLSQAQAEMENISRILVEKYPETNAGLGVRLVSLQEQILGDVRPALFFLLIAVALVMLIACSNVASLQLARAIARKKEFAIRVSLGAQRSRIFRQMITESALLCLLGGAAGLLVAYWSLKLLISPDSDILPRIGDSHLDLTVLGYTLFISALAGAVSGLVPAFQLWRSDLSELLKSAERDSSSNRRRIWTHNVLVVAEIALALMLLIGSGLMIKNFLKLSSSNPGFNATNLLTMQINLSAYKYPKSEQQIAFYRRLIEQTSGLPELQSVGITTNLPFGGRFYLLSFTIKDKAPLTKEKPSAQHYSVSKDYFRALNIPLRRGRLFDEQDNEDSARVAIISETTARRYLPGDENPIGQQIIIPYFGPAPREIVGVVGDVKHNRLDTELGPSMYTPYLQTPMASLSIASRFDSEPSTVTSALRQVIKSADKDQPVFNISTMDQLVGKSVSKQRFYALLLTAFAGLALVLAAIGVHGVISYSVSQRVGEIGIRIAIGASRSDIMKIVFGHGLALAAIGITMGILVALALTRFMSTLLYGISTIDPIIFLFCPALIGAIACLASYLPARKAMRVDPLTAVRSQ
jgi:putative ABC transport system permease protein